MTRKRHERTVTIVTFEATCDNCGARSLVCSHDKLSRDGWLRSPSTGQDACPDCAEGLRDEHRRLAVEAATTRYIDALESGEPPLIHGRIYND